MSLDTARSAAASRAVAGAATVTARDIDPVRAATDAAVVDALLDAGRLTRAEIATAATVSKPTASESVRRLSDAGILTEAGRQEGGRGRVGVYYRIADDAGLALAIHAGAGSIVGECVEAAGAVRHRVERAVGVTVEADRLQRELAGVVADLERAAGRAVPERAVSIADPVDLDGRLVHLPGSPFVLGEADLGAVVGAGGVVDNDVNWAAQAELGAGAPDSFLYVHLGAGLGAALVDAGRVVRGRGVAGEIAYVVTADPSGAAMPLLDVFAAGGLCVAGSSTLDVAAVTAALTERPARIVEPLAGALASCAALLDPDVIVVGGPWARPALDAGLPDAVRRRTHRHVALHPARVADAPLTGARLHASHLARASLLAAR